jgi:hypothetical protein
MAERPDEVVDFEKIDVGPCCCCGEAITGRKNFVMLPQRGPVPGKGWGCVVCDLPMDGALYIACDRCVDENRMPTHVVRGIVGRGERAPIAELSAEPFDHDMSKHPEAFPLANDEDDEDEWDDDPGAQEYLEREIQDGLGTPREEVS